MSIIIPFFPPSVQTAEPGYPTSCQTPLIIGSSVIAITLGALGIWSFLAPLGAAAIAPGKVVVDSNRKTVQHLEGGVIREILVRDGDIVEAGQVLLRLDGARIRASLASLQPLSETNRAQKARLLAERDGLDRIVFPPDLVSALPGSSTADIVAQQERVFRARHEALEGEIALLTNRTSQAQSQLTGLRRQSVSKAEQIALAREELVGLEELLEKGFTTRKQVYSVRRALRQLESEYADLEARAEEVSKSIEYYRLDQDHLLTSFREQIESELQSVEKEAYNILEGIRAIGDQHDRLDVRAPVAGIVVDMVAHTVGGVIAPGSRILDIVPQDDRLVVEAQVRPADIDGVQVGLRADVRFPAFQRNDIPPVRGEVTLISADSIVNPATGTSYYLARVLIDETDVERARQLQLVPGMPAEVIINKGTRTVADYLISPLSHVIVTAFRE